jgi:hypothetical protein
MRREDSSEVRREEMGVKTVWYSISPILFAIRNNSLCSQHFIPGKGKGTVVPVLN